MYWYISEIQVLVQYMYWSFSVDYKRSRTIWRVVMYLYYSLIIP